MRIAIITIGSRGDVQPYIALGQGLIKAGHTVRLATHQDFEVFVKSHGLEFCLIHGNSQEMMGNQERRELSEKGNFLATLRYMMKEAERSISEWMEDGLIACQEMDLLIASSVGLTIGLPLAEKYHLPLLQAHLFPVTPTRAFPSVLLPQTLPNLGGAFNLISSHLIQQLVWLGARPILNRARKKILDLPPASFVEPSRAWRSKGFPVLYAFSPSVIPTPADWSADDHITGYWFLDSPADWTPPPDLLNFLQAGSPPVYIGFGSMGSRDPAETTDLVLQALAKTQQRAILLSGWGGLQKMDLPASVLMIDTIPHAWLFPRVAAVVHHGGAGTTGAGLRAGVPSIVIPFTTEQEFWGQRVHDLGVGPAPIPRSKLTVDRLARAIEEAVTNTAMRQLAIELGSKIRVEDGIANAVEIIQRIEGIKL
jgi:UDP:flavonoid glycosyltransferase YjiC (YdhE family)